MVSPNTMDSSTEAVGEISSELTSLLAEPFALEEGLIEMTLDEVGDYLESVRERFEKASGLPEAKESFEKVRDNYCSIMLKLESLQLTCLTRDILGELVRRNEGTVTVIGEQADPVPIDEIPSLTEENPPPAENPDEPDVGPRLLSPLLPEPQKFFDMAVFFASNRHQFPFDSNLFDRLIWHHFLSAMECETSLRLKSGIQTVWRKKTRHIHFLLNLEARKIELKPKLSVWIKALEASMGDWLYEGRFPTNGVLNSLRFILASHNAEDFIPSPLESASLLLFFGHDLKIGDLALKNILKCEGLDGAEVIELSLHLMKAQKLKNKVLTMGLPIDESLFTGIVPWLERVFSLLSKLRFNDESGSSASFLEVGT